MKLHKSAEDYLEAILVLQERHGQVRSIDIARHLDYSKPSVSVAMKHLREDGFVEVDENGFIHLLPPGQEIAAHIYELHCVLSEFLVSIGVSDENAAADACRIEHDLSEESVAKLTEFVHSQKQK